PQLSRHTEAQGAEGSQTGDGEARTPRPSPGSTGTDHGSDRPGIGTGKVRGEGMGAGISLGADDQVRLGAAREVVGARDHQDGPVELAQKSGLALLGEIARGLRRIQTEGNG